MPTNELTYDRGFPVSLIMSVANPGAGATTGLTYPQGGNGFIVPDGYAFHPMLLSVNSNADLTGGTATFVVRDNGTAIANGPSPVLSDTVQQAVATKRPGASPIAAGHRVDVAVVTDGSYAPTTADLDALLSGVLLPVP